MGGTSFCDIYTRLSAHIRIYSLCAILDFVWKRLISIISIYVSGKSFIRFLNMENDVFSYDKLEIKLNGQVGLNMYNDG